MKPLGLLIPDPFTIGSYLTLPLTAACRISDSTLFSLKFKLNPAPNIFYKGQANTMRARTAIAEPEADALGHCKAIGAGRR